MSPPLSPRTLQLIGIGLVVVAIVFLAVGKDGGVDILSAGMLLITGSVIGYAQERAEHRREELERPPEQLERGGKDPVP